MGASSGYLARGSSGRGGRVTGDGLKADGWGFEDDPGMGGGSWRGGSEAICEARVEERGRHLIIL